MLLFARAPIMLEHNGRNVLWHCAYVEKFFLLQLKNFYVHTTRNEIKRRHDTQHNGIRHNDVHHSNTQYNINLQNCTQNNDTQHKDAQHNDAQYTDEHNDTQH